MRNVYVLSLAQALSAAGMMTIFLLGGIIGSELAPLPQIATLPVSLTVVGLALTAIPGIGRKLAERLVLELRDRLGKPDGESAGSAAPASGREKVRVEALLALTSLGYQRAAAEKALRAAIAELNGVEPSVEALIKLALRHATRG